MRPVARAVVLAAIVVAAKAVHLLLDPLADPAETIARQIILVGLVVLVVRWAVGRGRVGRVMGLRPPGRARRWAWTVLPAAGVLLGWLAVAALRGGATPMPGRDVARIVIATGFGEEFLFRGAVYGLAARGGRRLAAGVSSAAFGWWHLVDALHGVHRAWPGELAVAFVAGSVALMTVVALVVFVPLRRRSGSTWGPALLHAAWNLGATLALGHLVSAHL